eukprot:scaffold6187_cov139-Skeletonema_menzelii.AAC.18
MQRRKRNTTNGSTTALPLRVKNDEYPRKNRAARRELSKRAVVAAMIILSILTLVGFIVVWESVVSFFRSSWPSRNSLENENGAVLNNVGSGRHLDISKFYEQRPLDQFSELRYALEHSKLVLLYFAASWCPMSTPISDALDEAFGTGDVLLTRNGQKKTLSIVYVSSDETLDEFHEYTRKRHWLPIPFDSAEKNQLKRHFATCAHRELEELQFDRKHEIPTGIVIDSRTQGIITTNGADDVDEMGAGALDHWLKMQGWASQMANRIAHENDSNSQKE